MYVAFMYKILFAKDVSQINRSKQGLIYVKYDHTLGNKLMCPYSIGLSQREQCSYYIPTYFVTLKYVQDNQFLSVVKGDLE